MTTRTHLAASVAVVLAVATATAGVATAQSDRPTLRLTEGTTTADGNTGVGVVLTSAPDGLAGYYLDVTVESPADGRIVDASYPEQFGLTTDPDFDDDGVTLEAADLDGAVEAGATDVRLATVVVTGEDPTLSVDPRQFDADDGASFAPVRASQQSPGEGAATDAGSATDATETSGGSGPLPAVLVAVAVAVLGAIAHTRRRGD